MPRIEPQRLADRRLQLPGLPEGNWGAFAVGVLTVALIASVEEPADSGRGGPDADRSTQQPRIGNWWARCSQHGLRRHRGLPITGVIVRSSANVAAGARTRASSILHGVWVLVFALPFAGLATQIPMAALAGLLIVIGVRWSDHPSKTARRTGDLSVYLVTLLGWFS